MPNNQLDSIKEVFESVMSQPLDIQDNKSTFKFSELWGKKDEKQEFLIDELIAKYIVNLLVGIDGIGKTQLAVQLCLHIALKLPTFLNLPLNCASNRALIVATEDSKEKFIKAAAVQGLCLDSILNPENVLIDFTEGDNFENIKGLMGEIIKNCEKNTYDIIIIDALSDLFNLTDGSINDNGDARAIISMLQHICKKYKTTILLLHHVPKSKMYDKKRTGEFFLVKDDSQGASSITQKARTVLALTHDRKSVQKDGSNYTNYLHVLKTNVMGRYYNQNALKLNFDLSNLLHSYKETIDIEEHEQSNQQESEQNNNAPFTKKSKEAPFQRQENLNLISFDQHYDNMVTVFGKMDSLTYDGIVGRMKGVYNCGANKIQSSDGLLPKMIAAKIIRKEGKEYFLNKKKLPDNYFQQEISLLPDVGDIPENKDDDTPF